MAIPLEPCPFCHTVDNLTDTCGGWGCLEHGIYGADWPDACARVESWNNAVKAYHLNGGSWTGNVDDDT